jgi:hypothetical protein
MKGDAPSIGPATVLPDDIVMEVLMWLSAKVPPPLPRHSVHGDLEAEGCMFFVFSQHTPVVIYFYFLINHI